MKLKDKKRIKKSQYDCKLYFCRFWKIGKSSPIKLEKKKILEYVYDIIYNPKFTKLLKDATKMNINITNGLMMNLYQAVYAIHQAMNKKYNIKTIYKALK